MTLPTWRTTCTSDRLEECLDRLREGLDRPAVYLETWWAEGHPAEIERRWFNDGGPDGKLAPYDQRVDWLNRTIRDTGEFYSEVRASHGIGPPIAVYALRPRWVWTKNTLRSTYEPVTFTTRSATVDSSRLQNPFDAEYYAHHGGPFTREMLARGAEPWNVEGIRRSLQSELSRMMRDHFDGRFTPRRYVA